MKTSKQTIEAEFVCVCNGHYEEPNSPNIEGIDTFKGVITHSHTYRNPQEFKGKTVALLGASASGVDLGSEIASVADKVYLFAKSWGFSNAEEGATGKNMNIYKTTGTFDRIDGNTLFCNEKAFENIDCIVFCTGYKFTYPFLKNLENFGTKDNLVQPLYKYIWWQHDPSLIFIGIPFLVIPFPMFECQARVATKVAAGEASLPDYETMKSETDAET